MGKHKKRNKETGDNVSGIKKDRDLNVQSNESGDVVIDNRKVKKKKKRDQERHETDNSNHANEQNVITGICQDDEHKKVKYLKQDLQEDLSENMQHSENDIKKHKKKKKKKDKDQHFDCEFSNDFKNISNKSDLEEEASQKKRKRTKKNDAEENGENDSYIDSNCTGGTDDEVPKKKRKKKSKEVDIVNSVDINSVKKKKKKKDKFKNESTCIGQSPISAMSCVDEKHSSLKSENNIIARADSKEKCDTGQWHTNVFEDEEKQNKFLRLLGGFKNSANKSLIQHKLFTNNNVKSGCSSPQFGGTLAMDKSEQETYKKTMTTEYESAMSMHLNRGLGLGFQKPQPTKKFSIDTQNSKSIKFDDSD